MLPTVIVVIPFVPVSITDTLLLELLATNAKGGRSADPEEQATNNMLRTSTVSFNSHSRSRKSHAVQGELAIERTGRIAAR